MNELSNKPNQPMTTMKTIGECLAVIAELHPSWKYNETLTPNLWFDALKYYPEYVVKKSVLELAQNSKYVPKLAEVIELIKSKENLPPKLMQIGNNYVKQVDDWWLSLSDEKRVESHQKQMDHIKGLEVELNDYELYRADLMKGIVYEQNN